MARPSNVLQPLSLALAMGLVACQAVAPTGESAAPWASLSGQVDSFLVNRFRVQADLLSDVAPAAGVSFIDVSGASPVVVATTVTDGLGRFQMSLPHFQPTVDALYYLEAFKGLNANRPGANAARVRTLIQWKSNGWRSLTGATLNLNLCTTALAVAAQLNTDAGAPVDLTLLIGSLTLGTPDGVAPDTYQAVPNLSVADFDGAYLMVNAALGGDMDPIASVGKASGSFFLRASGGALGVSPGTGASVGDVITLSGMTFEPDPHHNWISFNGVQVSADSVSGDRLSIQVTVPEGATRGPIGASAGARYGGVADYPILGSVRVSLKGVPLSTQNAQVTLTPGVGGAQVRTVGSPGASCSVEFKGLLPSSGWSLSAQALDGSSRVLASSTQILGAMDPVLLVPSLVPGPYVVQAGLNAWSMGLASFPLAGLATGSF